MPRAEHEKPSPRWTSEDLENPNHHCHRFFRDAYWRAAVEAGRYGDVSIEVQVPPGTNPAVVADCLRKLARRIELNAPAATATT
jgi:hypothetical protein